MRGTVLTRFEAERQTLAMMDHPNVAKIFATTRRPALTAKRDSGERRTG